MRLLIVLVVIATLLDLSQGSRSGLDELALFKAPKFTNYNNNGVYSGTYLPDKQALIFGTQYGVFQVGLIVRCYVTICS
jgi:hypothetical protein